MQYKHKCKYNVVTAKYIFTDISYNTEYTKINIWKNHHIISYIYLYLIIFIKVYSYTEKEGVRKKILFYCWLKHSYTVTQISDYKKTLFNNLIPVK